MTEGMCSRSLLGLQPALLRLSRMCSMREADHLREYTCSMSAALTCLLRAYVCAVFGDLGQPGGCGLASDLCMIWLLFDSLLAA